METLDQTIELLEIVKTQKTNHLNVQKNLVSIQILVFLGIMYFSGGNLNVLFLLLPFMRLNVNSFPDEELYDIISVKLEFCKEMKQNAVLEEIKDRKNELIEIQKMALTYLK